MKILLKVILGIVFTFSMLVGSKFHTPFEILTILDKSKIRYQISSSENLKIEKNTANKLNEQDFYVDYSNKDAPELKNYRDDYDSSPGMVEFLKKTLKKLNDGDFIAARADLLQIHSKHPKNSQIMTYIGKTYENEKQFNAAKMWYENAVKNNKIDYLAHYFLAEIYYGEKKYEDAVKEITIAHVLNRNDPDIFEKLKTIYKDAGMKYKDWDFSPRYSIIKNSDGSINLEVDKDEKVWLGYMLGKAAWKYEPGYKESMLEDPKDIPELIEEKECIAGLVAFYKNRDEGDTVTIEAIDVLIKSLDNDKVTEFILYEILLKDNPMLILLMDPKFLDTVPAYIFEYRVSKI
jgi:tetratricopeptide (TPR) repeat protein